MSARRYSPLMGAMLASFAFGAIAQTTGAVKPTYEIPTGGPRSDEGPRGITLGDGLALYPSVGFSFGRDDNLFLSSNNPKSSDVYTLAPGLKLQARRSASIYTLDLYAKSARYESSRADDYTDTHVAGTGEFVFSSRAGLRLALETNKGHDARGSTDRGNAFEPDVFRNSGANGLFAFGGNDARGRVEVEAGSYRKRYQNNRATTFASDRDTNTVAGRFFTRLTAKTSFLVEARAADLDYKSSTSPLDSKEYFYLAGVTWEATAATSGTVKVGQIRKDFSSSSRADFSGTGWDASMLWAPMTYSKIGLYAVKDFGESTGLGDFILSKRAGATWTHDWNPRLTTIASIARAKDDYSNGGRNDTTDSLGFKVNYKVQRWLILGGEYSNTDRDSNLSVYRYKRNIYTFTVGATL